MMAQFCKGIGRPVPFLMGEMRRADVSCVGRFPADGAGEYDEILLDGKNHDKEWRDL